MRARTARRRRDSVRWADASEACTRSRSRGLSDHRDALRRRRSRRGPRAVRRPPRSARHPVPGVGDRTHDRRGADDCRADRLSRLDPSLVRPWWPRDARLLLPGRSRCDREPGPDRPLHRERARDRRGRSVGRKRDLRRRGHAARRGSRRALGRFRMRATRAIAQPVCNEEIRAIVRKLAKESA